MSSLSFVILGACLGSVISVFALVAGIIADEKSNNQKHREETETAYKEGVIAGSRWKEAEKRMIEEAMSELRKEIEELEGERHEQHR